MISGPVVACQLSSSHHTDQDGPSKDSLGLQDEARHRVSSLSSPSNPANPYSLSPANKKKNDNAVYSSKASFYVGGVICMHPVASIGSSLQRELLDIVGSPKACPAGVAPVAHAAYSRPHMHTGERGKRDTN